MPPLPPLSSFDLPDTHDRKQRERARSDRAGTPFENLSRIELDQRVRAERAAAVGEFLADVIVGTFRLPGCIAAALRRAAARATPRRPAHE